MVNLRMRNLNSYIFLLIISLTNFSNAKEEDFFKEKYISDVVYGKNNAPIQVLEYYSLTCPHCSHFYENTFPSLKKEYIDTGKIQWIKRSHALDRSAVKGTMFLECAPKNRIKSYLKILLNKQSNWAYQKDSVSILSNIAALGGMPKEKFEQCMEEKEIEKDIIDRSRYIAETFKITGTPSFFINQEQYKLFSESSFKELFDKLLKEKLENKK